MDISHNFQFRWNNHISHLSQAFSELRYEEVYCDTTLVTEEGFVLKVHGAVLIATSRYFENVLSDVTPDQHPIVVLKGIKFAELSCLLDYIYQGVTQIDQHLMETVLDAADLLEIKGLSKMKNNLSIKKLIAPSPSVALSRNSPLCSSSSKSPSPSPPRTHSPSCHSPASDMYTQSVALKPDTEEVNDEIEYANPKSQHILPDKSIGNERSVDAASTSKHSIFSTSSEYLEQTLGIDLSLSRVSCEENNKSTGKIHNLHEDTPLRKRKILKHLDDGASSNELELSKFEEEKSEDLMPHKKKRNFSKSDDDDDSDDCREIQEETKAAENFNKNLFWRENLWRENTSEYHDTDFHPKCISMTGMVSKQEFLDSFHEDDNRCSRGVAVPPFSENCILGKPSEMFESSSDATQSSFQQDPLFIPENIELNSPSACSELKGLMHNGPVGLDACNVTSFVAVNVLQGDQPEGSTEVNDQTKEVFREIGQRIYRPIPKIKRPLSKYNLFMKETYPIIAEQHPDKKGSALIKMVSAQWNSLPVEEKQRWEEKAQDLLKDFRMRNPNYVFCPKKFQFEKNEYHRRKLERRNMFKINPFVPKF